MSLRGLNRLARFGKFDGYPDSIDTYVRGSEDCTKVVTVAELRGHQVGVIHRGLDRGGQRAVRRQQRHVMRANPFGECVAAGTVSCSSDSSGISLTGNPVSLYRSRTRRIRAISIQSENAATCRSPDSHLRHAETVQPLS